MLRIYWGVHFVMETDEKPVQNTKRHSKKRRSQVDKVGRLKYLLQQNREMKSELKEIKLMLRSIHEGLKPSLNYDRPFLEKFTCKGQLDIEILQLLFESGPPGLLPRDIAVRLSRFEVSRHQVSRRILRMNKRLRTKLGELVAEQ